jgi:hypothetical protein
MGALYIEALSVCQWLITVPTGNVPPSVFLIYLVFFLPTGMLLQIVLFINQLFYMYCLVKYY